MAMTIAQAVKKILRKEPFYGLFLLGLNKYFDNSVPTACVVKKGINVELIINEDYGNSLSDTYKLSILFHECDHILFKHLGLGNDFSDQYRLNIAMDCHVNSYIQDVPDDGYHPKDFGFEPALGTKYYYENLPKEIKTEKVFCDEHNWKDFKDLSEAEKKLIENQIDYQAKNVAEEIRKNNGHVPGHLEEYINSLFKDKEAVFNGKSYFKRVVGNSIKSYIKSTRYRTSYFFKDQPGICLRFKPKILVAIDTSGSISKDELSEFFTELNYLYKSGVFIEVVEFDTIIQNKFVYKGQKTDIKILGRGGTDLSEVYSYYTTNPDFSTLVIFTDGYMNINYPKHRNMIGVISSQGSIQNYPGIAVYIPKEK